MRTLLSTALIFLAPNVAFAHCPLCTAGAGLLAAAAASLGVSSVVVGVFIGAFALALSLWISGLIKKRYVSHQSLLITAGVYLSTIIPIMPLVQHYAPLYVSLWGEYGSLLHNTYTVNRFVLGAIVGGIVVLVAPVVSRAITRWRDGHLPYQGLALTFTLLIISSVIAQVLS